VLRYTRSDRLSAYKRIFGYGGAPVPTGSRANTDYHKLFSHFVHQVTLFWRDKRISDVIRERAYDSELRLHRHCARAGLDLRNNLKWLSFGHLNVLRVEVMQLLEEAFKILDSDDVKRLFGADKRLGRGGRSLIRYSSMSVWSLRPVSAWALPDARSCAGWRKKHILQTTRAQFETLLPRNCGTVRRMAHQRAGHGLSKRTGSQRVLPWDQTQPTPVRANGRQKAGVSPQRAPAGEFEFEV